MAKQEKNAAELYREERKKRIAKAAKSNSKKHMSDKVQKGIVTAISVLLCVAIVGAIAGGIVKDRGVFERNKVIMTIGDTEIDKYEYSFYYTTMLKQMVAQTVQYEMYGMSMGVDFTKSLASQPYTLGELEGYENPTFADYFEKGTIDSLKYVKGAIAYAAENNITLDEEDYKAIDAEFDAIDQNRVNADGTKYSVSAYLRQTYGSGMTEKLFRRILEERTLAQKVAEVKQEEFKNSYTDEEVKKAYNDGIDNYGCVSVRNYTLSYTTAEAAEPTEAEIAAVKAQAKEFAESITDEASFKTLAAEHAKASGTETADEFLSDESLTLTKNESLSMYSADEKLYDWVKTAKAGATFVSEGEDSCTVYYMVAPLHKAPDTVNDYDVRHILVKFPEATEKATDGNVEPEAEAEPKAFDASAYDANIINNIKEPITNVECYNKAIDILTTYLEGDKTEDAFAELAKEHSEDGNAAEGGIYEAVPLGRMVSEFEGWAADFGRKAGDVGIVETEFGYHIMYYIDKSVTTLEDTIRTDLATEAYSTFYEELLAGDNVAAGEIDAEMSAAIDADMDTAAKNLYKQYQSYYSSSYGY